MRRSMPRGTLEDAKKRPTGPSAAIAQLTQRGRLLKGADAGDRLAKDERVNVVRTLIRVDALEIGHVAHRTVLGENPDRAEEATRFAGDISRHVDVVSLGERHLLGCV